MFTMSYRAIMRWVLAAFYAAAGLGHMALTDAIMPIMPDWVPYPREVIIVTGLCEIAGAVAILIPRLRRVAGIMLALYAVAVFPANLKHAFEGIDLAGVPNSWWYHGPRLLLQPVIVWWALFSSGVTDWPNSRPAL
jgi:uncharacterized membrane protein